MRIEQLRHHPAIARADGGRRHAGDERGGGAKATRHPRQGDALFPGDLCTAVEAALETEDFAAAMTALARLRAPVDAFFDGVMVNSEVPAERENRLKLLGQVRDVMGRVADFGQIAG